MPFYRFAFLSCFLIFSFPNSCVSQNPDCNDCCNNYKEINEPRRSTKSVWQLGEVPLCDWRISPGWYRFTSFGGSKMSETVVDEYHCGTHDPIWLKGTHPTKEEENVVRKACINSFGLNDGCFESFDINIVKCKGDYFVYHLRPPDYCAAAYCAGSGIPCPYGKEGEHPNCYDPPAEFSADNFGDPHITYAEGTDISVTLICKVPILNGIEKWSNVTYRIEWFAEGNILKNETRCSGVAACPNGDLISHLPGNVYKIGQSISCNVSAKFTTPPKNVWSTPKQVPAPFFAGLKVYPTVLNLEACDKSIHVITITPTIPVRKSEKRGLPKITFASPPEVNILDSSCLTTLREGIQPVEIKIKAACKQPVTKGLKVIIPKIHHHNSAFWNRQVGLPTIWVNIRKNTDIHQCLSCGDPHYHPLQPNTFGSHYDFMGRGDFVLYKNAERYFEVQTRQWTCGKRHGKIITCNCGAVLRDHNDVIEFNCCNELLQRDKTTPITVKIRSKKCLSPGISIKNVIPGVYSEYEVMFPSGAKCTIQRTEWGLNVYVYTPRARDIASEKGLCLNPDNSNHDVYGNSLRIQSGQSYFDTLPPPVEASEVTYTIACQCLDKGNNPPECKNAFDVAFPTLLKTKKEGWSPMFLCDRQKRDLHYSDDPTDEDMQLFKETPVSRSRFRREVSNEEVSKENATRYCAERISETKIGKLCANVGVNVQTLVNVCSIDIEFTGDFSYAVGGLAAMLDQCGNLAARNFSMFGNDSSEEDGPTGSVLVEEIADLLCPNDCSSNGECVNGSCVCRKDYTSADCSVSIFQIPTIVSLQGDGLCDRRKRPCRKVTVLGAGFLNSENMTCHVKEFKVVDGSWTPNGTEHKFPGVMTDLVLTDCYLPESPVMQGFFHETIEGVPAAGLIISVSNDGAHKSTENLTFISYDSACMSCNISSGCVLKNNSCFINRYCFTPNETNPIDWCYQCIPDVSTNTWTERQVNLPPQFSPTTDYYVVSHERLELTIDVSDPEGMPVTVSLLDGSPSEAVIRDKILLWNATKDAKILTRFFLQATDACQAVSSFNISVTLVACPCKKNGSCVPHPDKPRGSGFYLCDCIPGFTGAVCETEIDDCQSYPCLRGRCIDGLNNFTCICDPGYVGRTCDTDYDDCSSSPCVHGHCTDYPGFYKCTCDPGYSGKNCTIDINECESTPCFHGTCVDGVNSYTCQCENGYIGQRCDVEINECQSSPCVHGTCLDEINHFTCNCEAGFTGARCEEDINNCLSSPCVNGTCVDLVNNYTCNCNVGFTGPICDVIIKNCTDTSCYPNVTCFKDSQTISCGPCPIGFIGDGKNCKDIDYCKNATCKNGGSCVDGLINYTCSCVAGFKGDLCETDIDYCINATCRNSALCVDGLNNYTCSCLSGFTGNHCETAISTSTTVTESRPISTSKTPPSSFSHSVITSSLDDALPFTSSGTFTSASSNKQRETVLPKTSENTPVSASPSITNVPPAQLSPSTQEAETDVPPSSSSVTFSSASSQQQRDSVLPTTSRKSPVRPSPTATSPNVPTPTEKTETEHAFQIKILEDWDDDLNDMKSAVFKTLSSRLEQEILKVLSAQEDLIGVKVVSFSKGSVIAEFKLMFKKQVSAEDAFADLRKQMSNGKLGSLQVDPDSLKQISPGTEEPTKDDKQTLSFPVIIGISCGGLFVIALVSICLIRFCQRKKMSRQKHRGVGFMPSEEAFPDREKYEMGSTKSEENIVHFEEMGIWAKPWEGKSNEAFC